MRAAPPIVIVLLTCFISDPASTDPKPDPWAGPVKIDLPPPEPAKPTVQMSWCAQAGCAITFTFSAPAPKAEVVFEPKQAGTQTWRTPTELVFTPGKGAMLAGHELAVSIPQVEWSEKITVPYFEAAGKIASWPVEPNNPRFVAFLNGFVSHIGRGPLFVLYDQPVDPAVIARKVTVKSGGKRVAAEVRRPTTTAQIYDHPIDLAHVVTIELAALPNDGELVEIELPSHDDDGKAAPAHKELMVNTTLTAGGFVEDDDGDVPRKGRRTPLHAEWTVAFSNQITSSQLAKHVTIEPKPKSMRSHTWGVKGVIDAELEPGTMYRVAIDGDLRDVLGNRLAAPIVASFRSADLKPSLVLPHDSLALEAGHARLPIQLVNAGELAVTTQRYASVKDWLGARGGTPESCEGTAKPVDVASPLNAKTVRDIALEPGLYCVMVTAKGRGSQGKAVELKATTLAQVTSYAATAKVGGGGLFAWLTRLADAKPVGMAHVAVVDEAGAELASGSTAADGTLALDKLAIVGPSGLTGTAYLVVGDGALVAPLADDQLSHARQFGLDGRAGDAEPLAASVFTERGVYRPGETVHIKAVVRDPDSHRAATGELAVVVADPRGEEVVKTTAKLDGFGGALVELALKDDAKVGDYTIRTALDGRKLVRNFRVEEYRVPTFAVSVTTDAPWLSGAPAHAAIAATYLHGGALAGREVKWELSRAAEPFAPAGYRGFTFTAPDAPPPASLTHGAAKLDGQGKLVVSLKPDHGSKAGPMRYTLDAAVADVDRQVYAGKLVRVVHPADLYVGIAASERRVVSAGDTVTVPVVAVTTDGAAKPGVDVAVTLDRVDYHGVTRVDDEGTQRLVRPHATTVRRCDVTTRARPIECKLVVPDAGEYIVHAAATDGKRRPVEAGFRLSASGGTAVAWPRFDNERIAVIADKPSYKVGDVARLVIQSPFPVARGLLTIERNGVREHKLFAIDNDTPEIKVPITAEAVPNVFASVVVVRGRIHDLKDATGFETGAPAFRMGYAELHVEPRAHRLAVIVKPETAKAFPGATLGVDVAIKDADGKPHAGQATLMVVDEAVLGMTGFKTPEPLGDVFAARPLGVRTGETRLDLLSSRRSRREKVFPAGDGGPGMTQNEEPRAEAPDELPRDMRRLFKSTAYYNAAVPIDATGHAHVSFALPDNVTTYRVMAVAVDDDTHVGAGQSGVLARKPLIVQPALPRFVHPGDRLKLEARVFNGTEAKGTVELATELAGIALDGGAPTATGEAAPNGEARFAFPIVVPPDARGEATVKLAAKLGAFKDGVEIKLPIVDPGSSRKLVVSKLVSSADKLQMAMPADRRPGTVKVELVASTTPLSELKDAVDYLMTYPNGCIEQTTSTAYPLVMLRDLLPEMGVTVDPAELHKFAESGVKRLLSFQTTSGGLAYWPGSDSPHAFGTAFGLTALIEAKKKGFTVPDAALGRMAEYLEQQLRSGTIAGEMPHMGMADADTRALFVMTLGRLGRPQSAYVSTLWAARDKLTPFGLAFLGVAIAEGAGDKSLLQPILAAMKAAVKEVPSEAWYDGKASHGWAFDSPLRTHGSALLAFASAGSASDGTMTAKLLTGLLARRSGGLWGNTQENVFGIMAVARATQATNDKPAFAVKINGKAIDASRIHAVTDHQKRLTLDAGELDGSDQLVVEITNGGKPVYATLRMEYIAKLDGANRAARDAGFAVTRRYETVDGASLEGKHLKLGSLVRVRLRVKAAGANHYVAIDDKLPAGLEPLNAALATTETVAAGKPTKALTTTLARLSYSELRDARVAFYIDDMPADTYEFTYVARATTPGTFIRPAAGAEAMYEPQVSGTSAIDDIVVE